SAAVRAEVLSKERFPVPLVARIYVAHDNPTGLPLTTVQDAAALARDVQAGRFPELDGLAAVVPIPDTVFEPGLQTEPPICMGRGRHADFQRRSSGHTSVESVHGPGLRPVRPTPGQPARRRQAIHESDRPETRQAR
ncbi:MAG: hypothetical protein LC799_31710, partial [Actinobacteria bacterium]|nr:hypothetical protein [Actinomycetota bacterium]